MKKDRILEVEKFLSKLEKLEYKYNLYVESITNSYIEELDEDERSALGKAIYDVQEQEYIDVVNERGHLSFQTNGEIFSPIEQKESIKTEKSSERTSPTNTNGIFKSILEEKEIRSQIASEILQELKWVLENSACLGRDKSISREAISLYIYLLHKYITDLIKKV